MAENCDLQFSEYEKMATDLNKFECTNEFKKVDWIVLEKIHGANFSFHTNGEVVRVARRRDFLEKGGFFNYANAEFMNTYPDKIKAVFQLIQTLVGKEIRQVTVYGELFGGLYKVDGETMNRGNNTKPVQKEILYCPDTRWCAFDVTYTTHDNDREYLHPSEAMDIFEEVGVFYLKPLYTGPMNKALNYELGFDSTLPEIFGLPPLSKGTNKAEGIVVKPIKTIKCKTKNEELERVIVKIKLPQFEETRKTPKPKVPQNVSKKKKQSSEHRIISNLMMHANDQRLVNAISKVGYPGRDNSKLIEEFENDLFHDTFEDDEELPDVWKELEENKKNMVKDIVRNKTEALINRFVSNEMSNT